MTSRLTQTERDWIRWQAERSYPRQAAQVTARWIRDAERGIYAGTVLKTGESGTSASALAPGLGVTGTRDPDTDSPVSSPEPWTCDSCGTVYRERPLIEGVAGCPNCGNFWPTEPLG